jgi:hypothetical protein
LTRMPVFGRDETSDAGEMACGDVHPVLVGIELDWLQG